MRDKRRDLLGAVLAAPCALVPALASTLARAAPALPGVGSKLALPDVPLIEGGTFRASEADGKVVAVYWWASWCPFCAEMSPHVERLWRTGRARGLVVLGISVDKSVDAARAHRARRGYEFPSAMYEPGIGRVMPKPSSVPVTWVRGRDGRVVMAETGQLFPEDVAGIARFL